MLLLLRKFNKWDNTKTKTQKLSIGLFFLNLKVFPLSIHVMIKSLKMFAIVVERALNIQKSSEQ